MRKAGREAKKLSNLVGPATTVSPRVCLLAAAIAFAFLPSSAQAQLQGPVQDIGVRPSLLKEVGIDQKLNESIPLDLTFRDEADAEQKLRVGVIGFTPPQIMQWDQSHLAGRVTTMGIDRKSVV